MRDGTTWPHSHRQSPTPRPRSYSRPDEQWNAEGLSTWGNGSHSLVSYKVQVLSTKWRSWASMSNVRKYLVVILFLYALIVLAGIIALAAGWYRLTIGLILIAPLPSMLMGFITAAHVVNSLRIETRKSRKHLDEYTSCMTHLHQQFKDEFVPHERWLASEVAAIRSQLETAQTSIAAVRRLNEQNTSKDASRNAAETQFQSESENTLSRIKHQVPSVTNLQDEIAGIHTRLSSLESGLRAEFHESALHRTPREDLTSTPPQSSVDSVATDVQNQANLDKLARKINSHITTTARDTTRQLEAMIHLTPSYVVDKNLPMPSTGGFAIDAQALGHLLSLVEEHQPSKIVEVGSGSSTIWLGYMCQLLESNLISIDHLEEYLTKTRTLVERHDLTDTVETRLAPLEPTDLHGETYNWYSCTAFENLSDIDLLFVDGPPESTGKMARLPALPNLVDMLSPNAIVILDDTQRKDETQILNEWTAAYPDFEQVEVAVSRLGVLRRKS